MQESCPIVNERVDEKIVRLNGLLVFIGIFSFVFFSFKWLILIVTADFFIRVFFGLKNSPICFFIKSGLDKTHSKPHLINAGPKKFAAKIGLVLTTTLSILYFLDYETAGQVLGIISLIAVGAEVFFNYCVACKVYTIIQRMGINI